MSNGEGIEGDATMLEPCREKNDDDPKIRRERYRGKRKVVEGL